MLEAEKQQFEEVVQELRMEQEQIKRWWWCPGIGSATKLGHAEPTFPVRPEEAPTSEMLSSQGSRLYPSLSLSSKAPGMGVPEESAASSAANKRGHFCPLEYKASEHPSKPQSPLPS